MAPDDSPEPIDSFPLMKLPPELRLKIYDQLFTDLTITRQRRVADLNKYHRTHEWPDNDFSAYLGLLLTCKEVNGPAKGLWENSYIRHCCFYTWKLPELHRIASSLVKLGEPYQSAKYALRTLTHEDMGLNEADFIELEGCDFMHEQPGFPTEPDYEDFHWSWPEFPYADRSGRHTLYPDGRIPVEIYRQGPKGKKFARASFPELHSCSIAVHDRHVSSHVCGTSYVLMSGEVGNIFWGKYDAGLGLGKQMVWDEWEMQGFPESSLARADIVLMRRAQLEIGMAAIWRNNRDKPGSHNRLMTMIEDMYNFGNWLRLKPSFSL